ncbi:peptide-N4-(N-acetyl-beta- glucosaminyl)asparagine amidase [Rhizoclosmatium sp. JEL0117]|nr:peptide-N4-(N-acetyl-beta- glucosaminyl)asparagine amidase [Rhizoclosmatium sp. JEL0117]
MVFGLIGSIIGGHLIGKGLSSAGESAGKGMKDAGEAHERGIKSAGSDHRKGMESVGGAIRSAGSAHGKAVEAAGLSLERGLISVGRDFKGGLIEVGNGLSSIGNGIDHAGMHVGQGVLRFAISTENAAKHFENGFASMGMYIGGGILGGMTALGYAYNPVVMLEPLIHISLYSSAALVGYSSNYIGTVVYPQLLQSDLISNKLIQATVEQHTLVHSSFQAPSVAPGTVVGVLLNTDIALFLQVIAYHELTAWLYSGASGPKSLIMLYIWLPFVPIFSAFYSRSLETRAFWVQLAHYAFSVFLPILLSAMLLEYWSFTNALEVFALCFFVTLFMLKSSSTSTSKPVLELQEGLVFKFVRFLFMYYFVLSYVKGDVLKSIFSEKPKPVTLHSLNNKATTPVLLGSARNLESSIQLTQSRSYVQGAFWYQISKPSNQTSKIITNLVYSANGKGGDGLAIVLHNAGKNAIGTNGDGLGYHGIPSSIAVEFDMYKNDAKGDPNGSYKQAVKGNVNIRQILKTGSENNVWFIGVTAATGYLYQIHEVHAFEVLSVNMSDSEKAAMIKNIQAKLDADIELGKEEYDFAKEFNLL